jgi:hypothetical protein
MYAQIGKIDFHSIHSFSIKPASSYYFILFLSSMINDVNTSPSKQKHILCF